MSSCVKDGAIHHDGEHKDMVGSQAGSEWSVQRGERLILLHRGIHEGGVPKAL